MFHGPVISRFIFYSEKHFSFIGKARLRRATMFFDNSNFSDQIREWGYLCICKVSMDVCCWKGSLPSTPKDLNSPKRSQDFSLMCFANKSALKTPIFFASDFYCACFSMVRCKSPTSCMLVGWLVCLSRSTVVSTPEVKFITHKP